MFFKESHQWVENDSPGECSSPQKKQNQAVRWASHCEQVSQLETTWQMEKSDKSDWNSTKLPFLFHILFFRKGNLTCRLFIYSYWLALKIRPLYPHSQYNSLTFPHSPPSLSPSLLHSERKEKVILRADHKLFSQVSSFWQTCDLKAQMNQLIGWWSLLILSHFLAHGLEERCHLLSIQAALAVCNAVEFSAQLFSTTGLWAQGLLSHTSFWSVMEQWEKPREGAERWGMPSQAVGWQEPWETHSSLSPRSPRLGCVHTLSGVS